MSSGVIFFTVVVAASISQCIANSVKIQDIDVDKLLEIIQQKRLNRYDSSDDSDSSEDSDNSIDTYIRSGTTEEDNIIDTLKQLFDNKSNKQSNRDDRMRQKKNSNVIREQKYDIGNTQRSSEDIANILNVLLSNDLKAEHKSQPRLLKKHLTPNRLLWDDNNRITDLQDYSKIYVFLTPKAVQKSKSSRSGINQLISKILSLPSSPTNQNRQERSKQKRYKGFIINDPVGRRRGSREMYAPNDSGEDKPKRGRNNGGGGGGHTAIPYIRHRGDNIYEKDN